MRVLITGGGGNLGRVDASFDRCGLSWTAHCKRGSCRTFLFWLVARSLDAVQLTVMENILSANAPRVSVARTTNENVPRVVGVPVIRPGLAVSRKPGGSWPERSVHVYPAPRRPQTGCRSSRTGRRWRARARRSGS